MHTLFLQNRSDSHSPGMGNIIELCAAQLYPDPKIYLGFTMCITRDYNDIPQRNLIEDCALEHAVDFDALNECVTRDDGAYGVGMLRDSVRRTAEVRTSNQPALSGVPILSSCACFSLSNCERL